VVLGQHTYADEGAFTVTVTISDVAPGTGTATATDTATVTEGDALSGSPVVFSEPAGVSFTTTVATFSDTLTSAVAGDFTATINWGDATASAGTVSGGGGSFTVSGTHTYAGAGIFPSWWPCPTTHLEPRRLR
jgi:PKD repeat protein